MNKYTTKKLFEKDFLNPIWKIEVDCAYQNIAVESRNTDSTLPIFTIFSFDGTTLLQAYEVNEKEWTLAAIQEEYLILKKYGSSTPIQAGIRIIHYPSLTIIADYSEYILQQVKKDTIIAIHRSIPSGLSFCISIHSGIVSNNINGSASCDDYTNNIEMPIPYTGKLPSFLSDIEFEDQIWLQSKKDFFIWSYHQKQKNNYSLMMALSSKNELFEEIEVLINLNKLILQPYFSVNSYIFFLSDTKQKIITYLV